MYSFFSFLNWKHKKYLSVKHYTVYYLMIANLETRSKIKKVKKKKILQINK